MRIDFSPTLEAARRFHLPLTPPKANAAPATVAKPGGGPRGVAVNGPRAGIWRALQEIQVRHA